VDADVSSNRATVKGFSVGSKYAIGCSTPFSNTRKSSCFRPGTNRPWRSTTLTGTATSVVSMRTTSPAETSSTLGSGTAAGALPSETALGAAPLALLSVGGVWLAEDVSNGD